MPSLVALVILAATPQSDPLPAFASPVEVAKALASAGYPFKVTGAGGKAGEISRGSAAVSVRMARVPGDPAKGTPVGYPFLKLDFEFPAPKPVRADEAEAWTRAHAPDGGITFASHLGNTVSATRTVDILHTTRTGLKDALDTFFATGRAFAKSHGAPFVNAPEIDEARLRFTDALKIDRADKISFRRAAAAWGWGGAKEAGYASQGWMLPVKIAGETLWLRQSVEDTKAVDRRIDLARYGDVPYSGNPWADRKPGDPLPSVIYGPGGMYVPTAQTSIDLTKGVALGELRRRIESFAKGH